MASSVSGPEVFEIGSKIYPFIAGKPPNVVIMSLLSLAITIRNPSIQLGDLKIVLEQAFEMLTAMADTVGVEVH
jgi:hypothetical protein